MAKQSALAIRRQKELDEAMRIAERITRQFDIDTLQVALNRSKLKLGYKRIMEITELWMQVREEYRAVIVRTPETDVARHHLDEEHRRIAKGHQDIMPCEQRYPELRPVTYEPRSK